MQSLMSDNLNIYDFENYSLKTLTINSKALSKNPWKDSSVRRNPVLVPDVITKKTPFVFVLSGFSSNGSKKFAWKSFGENTVQELMSLVSEGQAPNAIYIYVDAYTYWGGSQFINSEGMGHYEDYMLELYYAARKEFSAACGSCAVVGGSSGGYGALHLGSKYPELFQYIGAIAPDSNFDIALLPDIYMSDTYYRSKGLKGLMDERKQGKFFKRKSSHHIINALAMGLCYCSNGKKDIEWPVSKNGDVDKKIWNQWKKHDPLNFLSKRKLKLKETKGIYLTVGNKDEFNLHFGSRKISELLKENKIKHEYSEFNGGHFDLGRRQPDMWAWLERKL